MNVDTRNMLEGFLLENGYFIDYEVDKYVAYDKNQNRIIQNSDRTKVVEVAYHTMRQTASLWDRVLNHIWTEYMEEGDLYAVLNDYRDVIQSELISVMQRPGEFHPYDPNAVCDLVEAIIVGVVDVVEHGGDLSVDFYTDGWHRSHQLEVAQEIIDVLLGR